MIGKEYFNKAFKTEHIKYWSIKKFVFSLMLKQLLTLILILITLLLLF